jgi:uncharacterized protein (TIGR03435 family)
VTFAGAIRRTIFGAALVGLIGAMPLGFAQSAATAATLPAEFEAVSIHLVDPHAAGDGSRSSLSSFPANLFTTKSLPLTFLIQIAYNIESADYIAGMPGWMDSQEYDISAKVEGDRQLTLEQMRPMLQHLLEQRFHLAFHRETRMTSGFEMVVAKGGSKLKASQGEGKPFAQILSNRIDGGHMDVEHIAGVLAHRAGQPVVDKTGLKGDYDFTVSYAPANDASSSLPDFFTALQEQLGLKLESRKVPVDFLVIDHVEKIPTEN